MLDNLSRAIKVRVLSGLTRLFRGRVSAIAITIASFMFAIGAAIGCFWGHLRWVSLILWLISRILDGLDGEIARSTGTQSDVGGYTDIFLDVVVYTVIPAAIAARTGLYWALAALLGAYYINATSWMYLAAILEKRKLKTPVSQKPLVERESDVQQISNEIKNNGTRTAIVMPSGLIEGTETVILYSLLIILPYSLQLLLIIAGATLIGAFIRFFWALRRLS